MDTVVNTEHIMESIVEILMKLPFPYQLKLEYYSMNSCYHTRIIDINMETHLNFIPTCNDVGCISVEDTKAIGLSNIIIGYVQNNYTNEWVKIFMVQPSKVYVTNGGPEEGYNMYWNVSEFILKKYDLDIERGEKRKNDEQNINTSNVKKLKN